MPVQQHVTMAVARERSQLQRIGSMTSAPHSARSLLLRPLLFHDSFLFLQSQTPITGVYGTKTERSFIAVKPDGQNGDRQATRTQSLMRSSQSGSSSKSQLTHCCFFLLTSFPFFCCSGVNRGLVGEIIRRFEQKGFKLVGLKLTVPTKEKGQCRLQQRDHHSSRSDLDTRSTLCSHVRYVCYCCRSLIRAYS